MPNIPEVIIKHILAVLNFPRRISTFIGYGKTISSSMAASPLFAALAAKIAVLAGHVNDLDKKQTATKTKPPTATIAERDAAIELVKTDLYGLRGDVQELADADPANSEAIISASAMSIKKVSIRGKQKDAAFDGPEENSMFLTGEGAGPHQWRMSYDGITWTVLPPTSGAKTVVYNLTPGAKVYFQTKRTLTKGKTEPWGNTFYHKLR